MPFEKPPLRCPICKEGDRFRFIQDFSKHAKNYSLYQCLSCLVEFWLPIKAPKNDWYEDKDYYRIRDLGQTKPYLPDIRTGQSLVAWSVDQVGPMIKKALNPEVQKELLANWQAPTEKATAKVANTLIAIAEGRQ